MKAFRFCSLVILAILMTASLTACSNDDKEFMDNEPVASSKSDVVKGISVSLSDFVSAGAETRTAYSAVDGGVKVTWASNDTIGIFPNVGGQVEFPIQAGTASNEAEFDGGGWALKSNSTYAAYYPYSAKNSYYTNKTIQVDYTGQKQTANGSTAHLGQYDYQATSGVTTNSSDFLNFQFKHLGALMVFQLTVPKAGTYTSLTLTSSEKVFVTKAELDISGNEPVLKKASKSKTFTLKLGDIALESDNSVLTAYMMLAPADLSQGSLELTIDGDRIFTTTLDGHNLEAGKQYTIEKAFATDNPSDDIIVFKDDYVKRICVEYFDTNGDSELSYAEAATVTNIPIFYNEEVGDYTPFTYTNLIYFNEFQYFTSLKEIPDDLFLGNYMLREVTLPKAINSIGVCAFDGCNNLTNIVIPNSVTTIREGAFSGCSELTYIEIPSRVTSISDFTFSHCDNLTNIDIPNILKSIGVYAFGSCYSLVGIDIPNGVTSIGNQAFEECTSLTNIVIPNSVSFIGENAFKGCKGLKSIDISNTLTSIRNKTFYGCSNLSNIEIPNSVTNIGDSAFENCTNLTNIDIPNSVLTIGEKTFNGCKYMKNIVIPSSVTAIGVNAFGNCSSLRTLTLLSNVPPVLGDGSSEASLKMPATCTIYVSAKSVDNYKSNAQWAKYASQIQAIPE